MQIKSVDRENEQLQHCLNSSNLLDIAKQFGGAYIVDETSSKGTSSYSHNNHRTE